MSDDTTTAEPRAPDADVKRLARALDDAWERMLAVQGVAHATDANRTKLAARIVWLAQQGEDDERQLSEAAAIYLCALIAAGQLRRDAPDTAGFEAAGFEAKPGGFEPKPGGFEPKPFRQDIGSVYDAQALAAMEEGLALCREALPDPISATVMSFLSRTILDHAAGGERNAVRLCNHALEALRSRR